MKPTALFAVWFRQTNQEQWKQVAKYRAATNPENPSYFPKLFFGKVASFKFVVNISG
jgi:hypothetical protein